MFGFTMSELISLLLPLLVIQFTLAIIAIVSIVRSDSTRGLPKWAWIVIVLVVNTIGPIAYFIFGREKDV